MRTIAVGIPLKTCKNCGADYVGPQWWDVHDRGQGTSESVAAQLRQAKIKRGSAYWNFDDLCEECEQAGSRVFTCALCHVERPSSEIERRYGDPAEYLCRTCYETVPAKQWADKKDELQEAHRWDHE